MRDRIIGFVLGMMSGDFIYVWKRFLLGSILIFWSKGVFYYFGLESFLKIVF